VEPLEVEAADAEPLVSVLADTELLASVLADTELLASVLAATELLASVLTDTELLASALPDTELVSPKPGLMVYVIATVVDICGVAARLRLGVAVRLRLGVAVKVLVKFFIKFLLNDFIADTILLVSPKTGRILIKAILKLVPLPIFIPPWIIMKLCVQFSIDLHSRHSDYYLT
jgi:hypothetical protein